MSDGATIHDLAAARAEDERQRSRAAIDAQLAKTAKGVTIGCVSNLVLIIGLDPALDGLLGYDEFTCAAVLHRSPPPALPNAPDMPGPYPRPWTGADVSHVQTYLQRVWTRQAGRTDTDDAMHAVAAVRRFHPVRDWLATLEHDGVARLDTWLEKAFGTPDDDYHKAIAAKLLIAAVRRVRQPGCKFDHLPVFEGAQGIGKSKTLAALFGPQWSADWLPAALESRDAALGLQGIWLIELGEIEQIIRAEVEVIKAFLSRGEDRFRAPYGRSFQKYPRQCVIFGTTNEDEYLRDPTGNRRFWPIKCTHAAEDWVAENRVQLFAEAAKREAAGEEHWLTDADRIADAEEQQESRSQEDVWADRILPALYHRNEVTVSEVLTDILSIPIRDQGKREQMRVGNVLRRAGWKRTLGWVEDRPVRKWERPIVSSAPMET